MADSNKLVMYSINPENPKNRKKMGVFQLEDGKVKAEFFNDAFEYDVRSGLFDAKNKRTAYYENEGEDGERFLELLADKFGSSSFVAVEKEG